MAITFIAGAVTGGTSAGIDTTGADLLVAVVGDFTNVTALTDSYGNTWTPLTQRAGGGAKVRLYYVLNPIVGSGHTFTDNGSTGDPNNRGVGVFAFSGVDSYESESGASGLSPGSLTPSEDDSLLVTGIKAYGSGGYTVNSGFTETFNGPVGLAYLVQTAAAAVNPTWTEGSGGDRCCAMAVFLPAAGGGGGAVVPVLDQGMLTGGLSTLCGGLA